MQNSSYERFFMKRWLILLFAAFLISIISLNSSLTPSEEKAILTMAASESQDYIKYIDFTPTSVAMSDCLELDIKRYGQSNHIDWITLLSLLASENYGSFASYKTDRLNELIKKIDENGIDACITNQKLYNYYQKAYRAVLGGMTGEYTKVITDSDGKIEFEKGYGLRACSPIARGYYYVDYDDFGTSRSYGYKRSHLGHDMLGSIGTPITAVESGYVEHLGWNMYGGWRIGIRSFDGQRYYYYAHLRANHPYANDMYEGKIVNAGEVIGYLGMTGYSRKENTNGIDTPHLHYGLQIIFDKSQIEGANQIWIDMYELTKFLSKNRVEVFSLENERYSRSYYLYDEAPD